VGSEQPDCARSGDGVITIHSPELLEDVGHVGLDGVHGELGHDGAQPAQESSREMDWIIVNRFDLNPHDVQVDVASRPLG
jgi:hypothetical protein